MNDDYGNTPAIAGRLVVGATITSAVNEPGDEDWFSIALEGGTTYQFQLTGGFTTLMVADGGGVVLQERRIGVLPDPLTFTPLDTATYHLGVKAWSTSDGDRPYTLAAVIAPQQDDFRADSATAGSIAPGGQVTGNFEVADDKDWFAATLQAGTTYQFELRGKTLDGNALNTATVWVHDPSGGELASALASADGLAVLSYTPLTSGTYYISAAQSGARRAEGSYTLAAGIAAIQDDYRADPSTTGVIAVGEQVAGSYAARDVDWFRIELAAGTTYSFNLSGEGSSGTAPGLSLSLLDAAGERVSASSSSSAGANSQATYLIETSAVYYVQAEVSNGAGNGTYTLQAALAPVQIQVAYMTGTEGNDVFNATSADDRITGGEGVDVVRFEGRRADYSLSDPRFSLTVTGQGTDTLSGIERLEFADVGVAYDLGGNAGLVARAIGALFGGRTFNMPEYIAENLSLLDQGMSFETLMQRNLDALLGPGASSEAIVNLLYANVAGHEPPAAAMAYYSGLLQDGTYTAGELGAFAANHALNLIHVVGLEKSGLMYAV